MLLRQQNALADGNAACSLADGSAAGDWRVPNRNELTSLLNLGTFGPTLPAGHPFMNVATIYWSSTTAGFDSTRAWLVFFDDGDVAGFVFMTNGHSVTAVRGGS